MDEERLPGFATLALHAGRAVGGSPSLANAENSPVEALEQRVCALEGGSAALALASGEAARFALFQAILRHGDEIVVVSAGSDRQLNQSIRSFGGLGWEIRWADPDDRSSVERVITPRTKAIFVETLSHAAGTPVDLAAMAQIAKRAQVPLIVDNTLATPFLCRPLEHGADLVLHAAGQFLGGQGNAEAGMIVEGGNFNWLREGRYPLLCEPRPEFGAQAAAEAFGNYAFTAAARALVLPMQGARLSPLEAGLILNGIETLPLRMRHQCQNALALAEFLSSHPRVEWVSYAGLPGDRHFNLARKILPRGAGAVLAFGLVQRDAGEAFRERLQLVAQSSQWGGARSIVLQGANHGEGILLGAGLEDAGDLIADIDRALGR